MTIDCSPPTVVVHLVREPITVSPRTSQLRHNGHNVRQDLPSSLINHHLRTYAVSAAGSFT